MKKFLILICILISGVYTMAQGINFDHGTWKEIRARAASENKYIFLDCMTSWCGPCKWMAAQVFPQAEVGTYMNKHFVSAKFDMEKGEGIEIAKQYEVVAYPTFLFFNPKGELVHVSGGGMETEMFLKVADAALDPAKQIFKLEERFASGERSPEFLRNFADARFDAMRDSREPGELYLNTLSPKALFEKENWIFIQKHVTAVNSPYFRWVCQNQAELEKKFPGEPQSYIDYVLDEDLHRLSSEEGANFEEWKSTVQKLLPEAYTMWAAYADYFAADEEHKHEAAKNYYNNYCQNWLELNTIAWTYYEEADDRALLLDADKWAGKSVGINRNSYNLDTWAHLKYKLGEKTEALNLAKEAVKLGQESGEDVSGTEELISKISQ